MKELVLGPNRFQVEPLYAMDAFRLQAIIAPALSVVFSAIGENITSADQFLESDMVALVPYVGQFFEKLPPEKLEYVTRELLKRSTVDNYMLFEQPGSEKKDRFNSVLQGRMMDVWKLVAAAIAENYADFLKGLGAKSAPAKETSSSEASTI